MVTIGESLYCTWNSKHLHCYIKDTLGDFVPPLWCGLLSEVWYPLLVLTTDTL